MYLQISGIYKIPTKYGTDFGINKIALYNDDGLFIKFITLDDDIFNDLKLFRLYETGYHDELGNKI